MITEKQFRESAALLEVDVAAIKAVAEVESGGSGFLSTGEPKILFEPHIFWKQLKRVGIDPKEYLPEYKSILYPVWKTLPYGGAYQQHARLQRAVKINKEAAFRSASWGKFQIMGFNYSSCKCANLQEFINAMYKGGSTNDESEHLRLFTNYILSSGLDDELQNLDWKGFARGYNGYEYARNAYDKKLIAAYNKYK